MTRYLWCEHCQTDFDLDWSPADDDLKGHFATFREWIAKHVPHGVTLRPRN